MSPYNWNSTSSYAYVFFVRNDGYLTSNGVHSTAPGLRPVINLKADIQFQADGNGTLNNPYVVA